MTPTNPESAENQTRMAFLTAAALWILIACGLCWRFHPQQEPIRRTFIWFGVLCGLCLMDLFALIQALSGLFLLMDPSAEKRTYQIIRTSYWGAIKLVCLIFLGTLLARGASPLYPEGIPTVGLLAGVSTLVTVPLLGGMIWYFRQA